MTKKTHDQLVKMALRKPGVKKAYDALEEEFQLLDELLKARKKAGKTQDAVAKIMKTTTSVVGRLETGGGHHRHSPTLETLRKYARAVDCDLEIKLVHAKREIFSSTKASKKKSSKSSGRHVKNLSL